jgi:hypothetical protein
MALQTGAVEHFGPADLKPITQAPAALVARYAAMVEGFHSLCSYFLKPI